MPVVARWTSLYDAVCRINSLNAESLNKSLGINKLSRDELRFLKEFENVMEPVSTAIDHLQATNCHLSIYLPTITTITKDLNNLKYKADTQYCLPLIEAMLGGLRNRFNFIYQLKESSIPYIIGNMLGSIFQNGLDSQWTHWKTWVDSEFDRNSRHARIKAR